MTGLETLMIPAGLWLVKLPIASEAWCAAVTAAGVVSTLGVVWSCRGWITRALTRKTPANLTPALTAPRLRG